MPGGLGPSTARPTDGRKPLRIARLAALSGTAATNQIQRTLLVEQIVANGFNREA